MPPESTVADEIPRLYGLEPSEFVAERNALAKEWRKAGRRADATVIAALRRPSAVESALNRVARTDRAAVVAWRAALDGAREAQGAAIGGGAADELRTALAHLRSATAALAETAARAAGDAKRLEIVNVLQAMSPGAADQVVDGVLGSTPAADEADPFAGAPDPPVRERPDQTPGRRHGLAIVRPADPDEGARRRALAAEHGRLAAVVEACRAAVTDADEARRQAEANLDLARRELAAAQSRLADAAAALAREG